MSERVNEITTSERMIMRIIWTMGQVTSRQVINALSDSGWSESTVKTLLNRLETKKVISSRFDKNRKIYSANISEAAAAQQVGDDLLNEICAMQVGKTLMNIIDESDISKSDINLLIQQLTEKLKSASETVMCNCMVDNSEGLV